MFTRNKEFRKTTSAKTKWNVKAYIFVVAMVLSFTFVMVLSVFIAEFLKLRFFSDRYVTSQYSKYCYFTGDADPSMDVRISFRTLSECGKPLYGYE